MILNVLPYVSYLHIIYIFSLIIVFFRSDIQFSFSYLGFSFCYFLLVIRFLKLFIHLVYEPTASCTVHEKLASFFSYSFFHIKNSLIPSHLSYFALIFILLSPTLPPPSLPIQMSQNIHCIFFWLFYISYKSLIHLKF